MAPNGRTRSAVKALWDSHLLESNKYCVQEQPAITLHHYQLDRFTREQINVNDNKCKRNRDTSTLNSFNYFIIQLFVMYPGLPGRHY